jgi:predicted phosphodiesterase
MNKLHDNCGLVTFDDINVAYATLWTNTEKGRKDIFISDHRYIQDFNDEKTTEINKKNLEFFIENKNDAHIIMTHHCPTLDAMHSRYTGDPYNQFFLNDLKKDYFDQLNKTKYWVYGHTHWKHSFQKHGIHFICNPLGYIGEIYNDVMDYKIETFEV